MDDFEEALEVKAVVFDGFFRAAAFDLEVFEKIFDEVGNIHIIYYSIKSILKNNSVKFIMEVWIYYMAWATFSQSTSGRIRCGLCNFLGM